MSFVEGNIQLGIELAPGTLDRLKANLSQLEKGINLKVNVDTSSAAGISGIGKAADQTANKFKQLSVTGTSAFGAIIDRAQQATSVVTNLGIQISKGAGLALAGLGIEAIHAGIAFNTLQQKTSGALKAILGGTQQAQALLKQVNTFVDTSPFGRDTFLSATQMLVGFGVEAKKVVPLLGAIQNAVGGIGGSDQDILSISQSLARVASSGKLTGDVLFSLQEKGIDAAGIIADQFGTTANTIRDQVSAGTIDADRAFDALINGLNKKFPDAAANVKNTFTGVVQRMNAAIRDIGANLTAAFINPEGGGGAVEGVNNIATALRNIQKNVIPALLPITQALADAFKTASEAFVSFTKGIDLSQVKGFVSSLAPLVPLLAGVGGVLTKVAGEIPVIGNLVPALDPVVGIIAAVLLKSNEFRDAIANLIAKVSPLVASILPPLVSIIDNLEKVFGKVAAALVTDLIPGVQLFLSAVRDVVQMVQPLVSLLSGPLVSTISFLGPAIKVFGEGLALAAVGFLAFNIQVRAAAAIQFLTGLLSQLATGAVLIAQRMGAAAASVLGFGEASATAAVAEGEAVVATEALAAEAGGLVAMLNPVTLAIVGLVGLYQILKPATLDAEGASKDLTSALEQEGNAATTATAALIAHELSAKKAQSALKDAGISTEDFAAGMIRVGKAGGPVVDSGDALVKQLDALSAAGGKSGKAADKLLVDLGNFAFDFEKSSTEANAFNSALAASKAAAGDLSGGLNNADKATSKWMTALQTAADNLDKVRAASDSLRSSQKALTDLQKTTAQQLNDDVTRAQLAYQAALDGTRAAADKVTTAQLNLTQAQHAVTKATDAHALAVTKLNRLLADPGAAEREIADAQETVARTQATLIDQDERRIELTNDLARLAKDTPDKLAAGDRTIERAKIALNNATRDQLNLEDELHKTQIANVDLSGLTPAQIRAKLAQVKAQLESQKNAKGTLKTEQQIADEVETAALNKQDAEQGLKDAIQARGDLETSINTQKREDEEALKSLALDHEDSLRRQIEQNTALSILMQGDTQYSRDLKAANEDVITTNEGIQTAIINVHTAEDGVTSALRDQKILALDIRDAHTAVRDATDKIKEHYDAIKIAAQKVKEDTQAMATATANAKVDSQAINAALADRIGLNAQLLAQNPSLLKGEVDQLLNTINEGTPGVETHLQKRDRLRGPLSDIMLNHPDQLLKFLRDNGFGFAEGGIVNSETFARIGEAGREVVLPLTRPARMVDLLGDSQVLHPVLAALGRIQLPGRSVAPSASPLGNIGSGGNVVVRRDDGPMTFGQARQIIALLEANGSGDIRVEAPITVNSQIDEDMLQRKIVAQLERKVYEILKKRR